jgi:hypothetical protein
MGSNPGGTLMRSRNEPRKLKEGEFSTIGSSICFSSGLHLAKCGDRIVENDALLDSQSEIRSFAPRRSTVLLKRVVETAVGARPPSREH